MQSNQAVLYVSARTEFRSGTHQDPHLTGTDFGKQFFLSGFCICFVDKGNLFFRNAFCNQLFTNVIVNVKASVSLGGGKVTETKLRRAVCFCILPDSKHVLDTPVYFALRIVRQNRIDQPLIQSTFPTVVRDLEHVILRRLNLTGTHGFCAVRKRRDELLLFFTGL